MNHKEAIARNRVKKAEKTLRNYENDKTLTTAHRNALVISAKVDLRTAQENLRLIQEQAHNAL